MAAPIRPRTAVGGFCIHQTQPRTSLSFYVVDSDGAWWAWAFDKGVWRWYQAAPPIPSYDAQTDLVPEYKGVPFEEAE